MEKENKKKEKNYWKLAFIGIGLTCAVVSIINSHRTQKKVRHCPWRKSKSPNNK